jgi:hypothetical protein
MSPGRDSAPCHPRLLQRILCSCARAFRELHRGLLQRSRATERLARLHLEGLRNAVTDAHCNTHIDSDSNSHSYCNAYSYANCDTDTHTYTDCNAYSYTYARADHAARACLQSARPANGRPLLEWADLG